MTVITWLSRCVDLASPGSVIWMERQWPRPSMTLATSSCLLPECSQSRPSEGQGWGPERVGKHFQRERLNWLHRDRARGMSSVLWNHLTLWLFLIFHFYMNFYSLYKKNVRSPLEMDGKEEQATGCTFYHHLISVDLKCLSSGPLLSCGTAVFFQPSVCTLLQWA